MSSGRYSADLDEPVRQVPEAIVEELRQRFWLRLRVFAARRLQNVAQAEDVAQETLRRVFEALREGRVENEIALPAFVFQTARNICLHERRSEWRKARAFERLAPSGETDPSPESDPLMVLLLEEKRAQVRLAFEKLESDDQSLLWRLFVEAADAEDVARRLGVSRGALRVRKFRALRRLAEILAEEAGNAHGPAGT